MGYPLGLQHEYTLGLGYQKGICLEIHQNLLVGSYTVLVGSNIGTVEATEVHHERVAPSDPQNTMDL